MPSQTRMNIETLRDLARRAGNPGTRFLLLGSGNRRQPRVEVEDLVLLDHCGMTRRSLYRVLALASGRLAADPVHVGVVERVQQMATAAVSQAPPQKGRRILVVEDNPTNRELIRQQLQLFGRDAEFAEDGQVALERWRSGDFALVLTDLRMPRMDGYAMAAAIRAEEQANGAPRTAIVALSANAMR